MIGLPTAVISTMQAGIDLRLGRDFARPAPRPPRGSRARHLAVAAGVEHGVGDAAHQVFAEPDLRVHHAGRGQRLAGGEVGEMRRHGGRADVDGDAVDAVDEAGPNADDVAAMRGRRR